MGPGVAIDTGRSPPAGPPPRAARLAWVAVTLGAAATVAVSVGLVVALATEWTGRSRGELLSEAPWALASACGLGLALLVLRMLPDNPLSWSFAVMIGLSSAASLLDYLHAIGSEGGVPVTVLHVSVVLGQTLVIGSTAAAVHLVTTFPDGALERWWERAVVRTGMALLVLPAVLLVLNPVLTTPWWAEREDIASPLHVTALAVAPEQASVALDLVSGVLLLAVAALVGRYRRSSAARRARMRWILVPMVVAGVATVSAALLQPPGPVTAVTFVAIQVVVYVAVTLALLQPSGVDPDHVLRRSLVYGVLWLAITGLWVLGAAFVGVTAGRASVGWAALVTMLAAASFQPARRRLEGLADRWVFGRRPDPSGVIARLGAALATTYDTQAVLPRMADTLREGLGLDWAEVVLDADGAGPQRAAAPGPVQPGEAVLVVPVVMDGETLGEVRCGPRRSGALSTDEVDLVEAFAHQAALAVRNVRLTHQLTDHAAQLAASRGRLVRAQEAERRRIERNIHDGVQQDLVALISHAGRAQRALGGAPAAAVQELATVSEGLRRVLVDLRELARGIHPSLLTDRGLLVAVEALAARSPVPTHVRADPTLREERLGAEVEAAAYFTVAEAVANTLKHAGARRLDVALSRQNGSLLVEVADDGCGMDPSAHVLTSMAERVSAVGGDLTVTSSPSGTTVTSRIDIDEDSS